MFKKYSFRPLSLIGLDIQPDAARLVQLKKTKKGNQIERIAMRPMPANIFTADRIQQWEKLSSVLAEWFEEIGVTQQPVAISLPMSVVRVQRISLPETLTATEIEAAIFSQLQREMPGLNESLNIDFCQLSHELPGQVDVMFAAVRAAYLSSYIDCMQIAGLTVKIVDVDLYALMRVVNAMWTTYAVLHIKTNVTELIAFSQHTMIFHQRWETVDVDEWIKLLDNNMQLYFAGLEKKDLQKVMVIGCHEYASAAMVYASTKGLSAEIFIDSESDFLVARGLAMRALPPW